MIAIRPVTTIEGCDHFQELQTRVWESDPIDVVPNHVTITVIKNGGMLLGAYADDGPQELGGMVGAAYWWLGAGHDPSQPPDAPPRLKVCSHILGVLPAWRGQDVGVRLKLAQRDAILAQGLTDWVTWTYEPLTRINGALNLHRLGATCQTYLRNVYGGMRDGLNAGLPSDRCLVDWRLNNPHVPRDLAAGRRRPEWDVSHMYLLPAIPLPTGFLQPLDPTLTFDGAPVAAPLPDDINEIRRADPELALTWRLYMRFVLERAFAAGYTLVDCVHFPVHGWRYILVRDYP